MNDSLDTSSISFTAHYTGYVWHRFGLSNPAFVTPQGYTFYQLLRPFELAARRIIGSDIKTTLLQRHHLIDRELVRLIHDHPDLQVLELACGLSPRGWRINRRYPSIHYIEADLQGMAERKHGLLRELGSLSQRHEVAVCNILIEDSPESLESLLQREFDPTRPVVVITEGLVNYFKLEDITLFWRRLAAALKAFPMGVYLSDVYPQVNTHRFYHWIELANRTLRVSSRSHFSMHFKAMEEARRCLSDCGYARVRIINPDEENGSGIPKARGGALVWVMRAETGATP